MKKMKELTYHIGLLVRAYPSDRQKHIIRKNAGVNRFVYNRLVAVNREMYDLAKTAPFSQTDRERLAYLKSAYGTTTDMRNAIPFLNDPDIDNYSIANAKRDYQKAWNHIQLQGLLLCCGCNPAGNERAGRSHEDHKGCLSVPGKQV